MVCSPLTKECIVFWQTLLPFTPPLVNVNLGVVGTFAYDRCIQNISFKTQLVEANSSLRQDIDARDDLSRGTGGLTSSEAGMVLSAMGLANCCGRIGFGQALDWWKEKVNTFFLVSSSPT